MEESNRDLILEEFRKFPHVTIFWVKSHPDTVIISATSSYIPIEEFKNAFQTMEELIVEKKIQKLIFDKRSLRVFHQPSMEWYFVAWKEKVADYGLNRHVKILPDDVVFCRSVSIGRSQLNKKYPNAKFHQLSILYAKNIEEALTL